MIYDFMHKRVDFIALCDKGSLNKLCRYADKLFIIVCCHVKIDHLINYSIQTINNNNTQNNGEQKKEKKEIL